MRLLSWLLCAAAAIVPVITSEEKSISRPKRESSDKKIVCYYTNWSVYRPGTAKFTPQNINPYLCTHLIYAFGGLSKENALKPFDKYQDIEQGGYAKFNGLKTYNKNLKTMLAIGGWNEGSARFSPLVADSERRRELVKNTVKFLRQNHFDGLDLDWEYPSFRDGGKPRDRDNYATLVQEFREEFERESEKTGRPRLLLTMAVPAGIEYIDKGYDVPKLNKYLDWMNILSYDYHSAFEPTINHHSPLFSLEEDDEYNFDAQLNIDYTVKHYVKLGADKSKLVLGIPTYGRSYTLFNPDATDIGSPADGPGEQGEATREKGYLAYYEICERVKSGGWTIENPNPEAMGPFAYKDNQWVGYDDEEIARAKAKYVNDNDLGGIMFWSIDNDDFRGKCHGKPYPLIEAAKEALLASANELVPTSNRSGASRSSSKKQEQETSTKTKARKNRLRVKASTTTTEAPKSKSNGRTTTTPQPPTTPDPGSDFVCKDEGFFPHPRDCKKYFWCLDSGPSNLGIVAHQFTCPSGLVFNKISDSCDYARNVICKTKSEPTTTTTTTTTSTTTARTTTARNRLVITASPPRTTTTTTTTTTEQPEEDDPEEDEEEEDPGTIKELINLIKKLGGVEQLEKQLNLQNSDGKEKIKPSLYSRVLQGRTANKYRGLSEESTTQKYVSVFRNRPVAPQSPSTEGVITSTRGSDKPRYVTIQRNRPTKKPLKEEEEDEEEEEEVGEEEVEEEEKIVQPQPKRKSESSRLLRRRPATEASTEKEYVVLRRTRPQKEEADVSTSKYKSIVRVRSTTEAPADKEEDREKEEGEEEEDVSEEEEEEVVEEDEEEKEAVEPGQKLKKYSSITRDNKKLLTDEEESKVSGPQGPHYDSGVSSATTGPAPGGGNNVNNVNTVTSPKYVEIRRKQSTTLDPFLGNDVNSVHNQSEQKETNEVSEIETESIGNGFQRRFTTDIVKNPTRPLFRSSTIERTTPISAESEVTRFRGRFRSSPATESTSTTESRFNNRYKTLNRNNPDKVVLTDENEQNQTFKRERTFLTPSTTTTTTSSTTTDNQISNGPPRRFQFAPRTKPAILSPKPYEATTEVFTITVPDLPDPSLTENILSLSSPDSPFPSVTLEPTTQSIPGGTFVDENDVILTTLGEKSYPSTRHYIPTTSTLTSVVTSITESSFTERKRISIPKRGSFKPELGSKYNTITTINEDFEETTKPLFSRTPGYRTITRSTTPRVETTTEARRKRFKYKSTTTTTTTTTEEPVAPGKKYVPKKTRTFKKISSTEAPEPVSSTTERTRFQPRNKSKQVQNDPPQPLNSLFSRLSKARRKEIFSKREEKEEEENNDNDDDDDDDLEVEQTATFFGDDIENNDRYILGGGLKQTSDKDYLNADVFLVTVPTVQQEEKSAAKTEEELANSIEIKKSGPPNQANKEISPISPGNVRESIRNRFATVNPSLRNLRTRTRQQVENSRNSTSGNPTLTKSLTETYKERERESTVRNNFFSSNSNATNFRNLRNRSRQSNKEIAKSGNDDSNQPDVKEPAKDNNTSRRPGFRFGKSRAQPSPAPSITEPPSVSEATSEDVATAGGFGTKEPGKFNFPGLRTARKRTQGNALVSTKGAIQAIDSNDVEESASEEPNQSHLQAPLLRNVKTRTESFSRTTESASAPTGRPGLQDRNFRKVRPRARQLGDSQSETSSNVLVSTVGSPSPSRGTKISTPQPGSSTVSRFRTSRYRFEGNVNDLVTGSSTPSSITSKEPVIDNFIVTNPDEVNSVRQNERLTSEIAGTTIDFTAGTPPPSTFGTKIGFQSTVALSPTVGAALPSTPSSSATDYAPASSTLRPTGSSRGSTKFTFPTASPTATSYRTFRARGNEATESTVSSVSPTTNVTSPLDLRNLRNRTRQNADTSTASPFTTVADLQEFIANNIIPSSPGQPNFKALRTRTRARVNVTDSSQAGSALNETTVSETENGRRPGFPKDRRRVLVRARPVQTTPAPKDRQEENELEPPEDPSTRSKTASGRRENQENYSSLRTRGRSTTQSPATNERTERRRTQLDRRRLRPETRTSTAKAETNSDASVSNPRSNILLRRRIRPTTSTTTTTTTTSEAPYVEQQEDSRLEESKSLDETPDIQDLADPAVVAIHNLATVSPGPIAPVVTSSLNPFTGTPATYTVHVTPSDIASFTTPGRISSVTSGSVPSRQTSILTLKPFTVPLITKQFVAKQTPEPVRAPTPFRATAIPVTEEPYSPRSELLIQGRRQEGVQRVKTAPLIPSTISQKETTTKARRVKPFSKVPKQEVVQSVSSPEPPVDYEYYDEDEDPLANIPASALKVKVHSDGYIECLDRGNFPHPFSCKKFISCAKMENNELLGWEYTCPKHLSFDPVGGICNWSAGLGCQH